MAEMIKKNNILTAQQYPKTLDRIAHEILERNDLGPNLVLVGIRTRGVFLANRLADTIKKFTGQEVNTGELDITLYRDDLSQIAEAPVLKATKIDFDLKGKTVILVDDVLYTGRTIRSALAALSDFGRPAKIELAVMVDRGHREIPIKADYVGKNVPTSKNEVISVKVKEFDGEDAVYVGLQYVAK